MATNSASNTLTVAKEEKVQEPLALARTALRPTVQAAVSVREYGKNFGDLDLTSLVEALTEQTDMAIDGNMARAEAMLTTQAHTLDAIFNNLARRAALNMGEYLDATDMYLKLALRAQSQCRSTWEALSAIKNPPVAGYVKQANIAHGPQQVNNGPAPDNSRTVEEANQQNKQLEEQDGECLDTGTSGAAGRVDPNMETLGAINRPKD